MKLKLIFFIFGILILLFGLFILIELFKYDVINYNYKIISNQAVKTSNFDLCKYNLEEKHSLLCVNDVIQSIKSNNSELCDNVKNQKIKDMCWFRLSAYSRTEKICQKIKNEEYKHNCLEQALHMMIVTNPDIDYCNYTNKDCKLLLLNWFNITTLNKNLNTCDEFTNNEKNGCYYVLSKRTNNRSFCEKMNDSTGKEMCLKQYTNEGEI
jgi:hypothetical protein